MERFTALMPVVETILSWRICLNLACPDNEDNCKQNNLSLGHGGGRGVCLCRVGQTMAIKDMHREDFPFHNSSSSQVQ